MKIIFLVLIVIILIPAFPKNAVAESVERCLLGSCGSSFSIKESSDKVVIGSSDYFWTAFKNTPWRCCSVGRRDYGSSYRRACLSLDGKLTLNIHTKLEGSYYKHGEGIVFSSDGSISSEGLWKDGDFYKSQDTEFNEAYYYHLAKYFPDCMRGSCQTGIGVGWANDYTLAWGGWSRGSPISTEKTLIFDNFKRHVGKNNAWAGETDFPERMFRTCLRGNCDNGYGVAEMGGTGMYWGFFAEAGVPHGAGKLENKEEIYVGDFVYGVYQGQGKLIVKENNYEYEGEFYGGHRQGTGFARYENGDFYKGEFYQGQKSGFGELIWANGNRFEGQWSSGKRVKGVWFSAEGEVYEGEYKDGLRHGTGKITFSNGRSQEGIFESGELTKHPSNGWQKDSPMRRQ